MTEIDELLKPEDILEEVEFEIAPNAFSAVPRCPTHGIEMQVVTATKTLWDGRLTVTYDVYECPEGDRSIFNGEQAKAYERILLLAHALDETAPAQEEPAQTEADAVLVRLPTGGDLSATSRFRARVTRLTGTDFLVQLRN